MTKAQFTAFEYLNNKRGFCVLNGYKYCGSCNTVLSIELFTKNKNKYDGLQCHCQICLRKKENTRKPLKNPNWSDIGKNAQLHLKQIIDNKRGFCILPGYKQCNNCQEILSNDKFYTRNDNSRNLTYLMSRCSKCENDLGKQSRRKVGIYPKRIGKETNENERECFHCNQILSIDNFRKEYNRWSNISRKCKDCYNKQANKILKENPQKRMKSSLSCLFKAFLKEKRKGRRMKNYLGCDINDLKFYIESKFEKWMTWENYGQFGWNIDHIIPCELFDLNSNQILFILFSYNNLRPLSYHENDSKNDFLPDGQRARNLPKIQTKQQLLDLIQTWPNPAEFDWVKEIEIPLAP